MVNERQLPPGDRRDAPDLPLKPIQLDPPSQLELTAIGKALEDGRTACAELVRAFDAGDDAAAATDRLVAALRPDPRTLARRLAALIADRRAG